MLDEVSYSSNHSSVSIKEYHIQVTKGEILEKIAVSYGIAQSLKLSEMEENAQKTILSTAHIPHNIAQKGKSQLKRKEIARMRGRLFIVKSDISLNFELLDTPQLFGTPLKK